MAITGSMTPAARPARLARLARLALVAALAASCAPAAAVPGVRFANTAAVTAVDDRRDVPARPRTRAFARHLYHFDGSFYRLLTRAMELPRPRRALGTNALDEVPDSTWFTNRIGVRDLSLDELRRGAATASGPEPHKPWTIHSTKVGGASVGFIISDARGVRYLLKFDRAGFPETETATEVITSKLLWACGYNVAEDHVVYLRPEDLVIAPDAIVKGWSGVTGRLDRERLERSLALIVHEPDGRIRAMASRMIEGKAIGGHAAEGVRGDDPNDRIPHELRRDLRGLAAFYAWLDQTDVKEDNTLDMWTADPANPRRHYVKHYLIDFGTSLGAAAVFSENPREGYVYTVDWPDMLTQLVTLGIPERSWERRAAPPLRGVGLLDAAAYDPARWKAETPAYVPVRIADDLDRFWASKILIRFTREQLRAVVETARLSDPRAVDYITDALVARQRATARRWFSRVSPLDRFAPGAPDGGGAPAGGAGPGAPALCFDDLMIAYGLEPVAPATRYTVTSFDRRGRALGAPAEARPDAAGHACAAVTLGAGRDAYSIVQIQTRRLAFRGETYVHLARDPATGAARVIGVWRP